MPQGWASGDVHGSQVTAGSPDPGSRICVSGACEPGRPAPRDCPGSRLSPCSCGHVGIAPLEWVLCMARSEPSQPIRWASCTPEVRRGSDNAVPRPSRQFAAGWCANLSVVTPQPAKIARLVIRAGETFVTVQSPAQSHRR